MALLAVKHVHMHRCVCMMADGLAVSHLVIQLTRCPAGSWPFNFVILNNVLSMKSGSQFSHSSPMCLSPINVIVPMHMIDIAAIVSDAHDIAAYLNRA